MPIRRVYIDGLPLVDGHFSGVGQYTLGVLRGLDSVLERSYLAGKQLPKVYVIIPRDRVVKFFEFGFKHIRLKKFPLNFITMSRLWHRNMLPPIDLFYGRGFYVFTRFVDMRLAFSKSATVVYDLSYESHKQYSEDRNAKFLAAGVRRSIDRSRLVFTISENSKKEIQDFYNLSQNKVVVATPAADQRYFYRRSVKEISRVKQKYGIEKNYILALSNLEPRKNLDSLVDAYCSLPEAYRIDTSLLLVGVSGWKTSELFQKIVDRVKHGYDIIRPSSYVSDNDRPAIISGAKLLVYPSHYEGFGMPPLEALACGVPVIVASNSSLPEVVGDAGTMLDHNNSASIASAMESHLSNIGMFTERSILKGPSQAANFDWEKSAQIYIDNILEISR